MATTLQKIEEQRQRLQDKLQKLKAKEHAILTRKSAEERKKETRKKVLLGAYILAAMEADDSIKAEWILKMDTFLKRDDERVLFGLTVQAQPNQTAEESTVTGSQQPQQLNTAG